MAFTIESASNTYCYSETISGTTTFTFPRTCYQFNITVDMDSTLDWTRNSGTYDLNSGESLTVPICTGSVTVVPSVPGKVRILALQ